MLQAYSKAFSGAVCPKYMEVFYTKPFLSFPQCKPKLSKFNSLKELFI